MSAQSHIDQGQGFLDKEKWPEAIECYKKALELEPNNHVAQFKTGYIYFATNKCDLALEFYNKALTAGKIDEFCHRQIGNTYMKTGQLDLAIQCYKKTLELNPSRLKELAILGRLLGDTGKQEEGRKVLQDILAIEPNQFKANYYMGDILADAKEYQAAIECYKKAIVHSTNSPELVFRIGQMYAKLGNQEEATKWYALSKKGNPTGSLGYCARGQCYFLLGEKKEAMVEFKRAQELLEKGEVLAYAPSLILHIKNTVKSILAANETNTKVEATTKDLDDKNPVIKHFLSNIKKLQEEKADISQKVVVQLEKDKAPDADKDISDLDRVKAELDKKLAELQAHLLKVESNVKVLDDRVTQIQSNMEEMKEELNNKLDNFEKKLEAQMNKLDIDVESQEKMKGYFKAFLGTFSSAFVTAQVVDSGQVSLDVGSSATTILSTLASFAPFVGSGLSSTVTSIGEFLKSKEMITSARKLKAIAPDSSALSQLIGNAAFDALMNKEKQAQVCKITDEDLEEISQNLFKKMLQFVSKISEKLDTFLYTSLYKTPSERLGHKDANTLIEAWISGEISPFSIQKYFMKKLLETEATSPTTEVMSSPTKKPNNQTQTACCNIF